MISATEDNAMRTTRAGRREWLGLTALLLPCLLYSMDLTALHLAVPALTTALAPTSTQLLWIIDIYGFLVAGAIGVANGLPPPAGELLAQVAGEAFVLSVRLCAAVSAAAAVLLAVASFRTLGRQQEPAADTSTETSSTTL